MKVRWLTLFIAGFIMLSFLGPVNAAKEGPAQPSKITHPEKDQSGKKLPNMAAKKWTGDLDGMIKRRIIRALVPYSKTFYFVDRGTQRGIAYDMLRLFEDDLNNKLKTKHVRVHVIFQPVSRDKIIPYLMEGKGDLAAANLTITPERLKQVDFSNPTFKNISEIVVTGPASKPLSSKDDLSGKEVYVRKSSSFYESLGQLNADFNQAEDGAGQDPVGAGNP